MAATALLVVLVIVPEPDPESDLVTDAPETSTTFDAASTTERQTTTSTSPSSTTTATTSIDPEQVGALPRTPMVERELPGTALDYAFPSGGAVLSVVGVDAMDVQNVRRGPGKGFKIATTLEPLSSGDAIATRNKRRLDDNHIWIEVEIAGTYGWADDRYLRQLVDTVDDTGNCMDHRRQAQCSDHAGTRSNRGRGVHVST